MRPSMHVWKIFFLYTKSFFKSYESLRHCELTTNVPNYCMNHRMPKCIFLLEAGLRIRSDIDRIRINLSGQTGSMNFLRLDPDPDTSVLKVYHLFYDEF